jgi:hypothetical protein
MNISHRSRLSWEDNIKKDLKEKFVDVDWIHVTKDREQEEGYFEGILRVPQRTMNF